MSKVLSASKCGFPCERYLFYSVNSPESESTSSRTQRIFDVGNALEPLIVDWLRSDGWDVDYNQGSQKAPLEVEIVLAGGKITGHPDCIISKLDGPHNVLVDIKTMNERSFAFWKRQGTLKSKPQYVKQLHVYAEGLINQGRNIEKLCIVGVNKNNSEMHFDFFDFDQSIADEIHDSAQRVFALNEAPIQNSPRENWCCSYCEFSHSCDLHNLPPMNLESLELPPAISDSEAVFEAMQKLLEARVKAKQAKIMEDEAKNVLDENIRQKGLSSVQSGGYICSVKEKATTRFDSAGFKKAHPDLAQDFTKECVSITYSVKEVI